ncbi:hypothetical protein EIN_419300 [Entamoeba invadens IP1]|uniref:Uncharacterized protein n=1 Tax=Entamoeba invadens IP1 TaxID=370355 RepID=A0A0A1U1V7_ENTIV|nr:hypothetical protein EIN_419300 [Entamoeba invadens IP1]ELP88001.1 hypothetical protein EIN_419300 [Entamoeba invadens IP1]|eukprot:XP_004254772.1 hypothetical protein EIN_419300 [Entamoeba invadens IP1]
MSCNDPLPHSTTENEENAYSQSDDGDLSYSSSTGSDTNTSESSDDDADMSSSELLEAWNETMKKLKFMMELYTKQKEENAKLVTHITEMSRIIKEMKTELSSLLLSKEKAVNDLLFEKNSHAQTLKKLEMVEKNENMKPFSGTLRCKCDITISNNEIVKFNMLKDENERVNEMQQKNEYLMKHCLELSEKNAIFTHMQTQLENDLNTTKKDYTTQIEKLQEDIREKDVKSFGVLENFRVVTDSFLGNVLTLWKKDSTLQTLKNDTKTLTDFAKFVGKIYKIDENAIVAVISDQKKNARISIPPQFRRKSSHKLMRQDTPLITSKPPTWPQTNGQSEINIQSKVQTEGHTKVQREKTAAFAKNDNKEKLKQEQMVFVNDEKSKEYSKECCKEEEKGGKAQITSQKTVPLKKLPKEKKRNATFRKSSVQKEKKELKSIQKLLSRSTISLDKV